MKKKFKEKKIWMTGLGFLVSLGVIGASQAEWVENILAAIFGW